MNPDFIHELFTPFRPVTVKRMFGGAGIYAEGLMFGIVFDGAIYLRVDAASIPDFEREGSQPFVYPLAKSPGRIGRPSTSKWGMRQPGTVEGVISPIVYGGASAPSGQMIGEPS